MNKSCAFLAVLLCVASSSLTGFRHRATNTQAVNNNDIPRCLDT
jgi:hypothetical protein